LSGQNRAVEVVVVGSGGTLSVGSKLQTRRPCSGSRDNNRLDRLQQLHGHVRPREQWRDQVRSGRRDKANAQATSTSRSKADHTATARREAVINDGALQLLGPGGNPPLIFRR
jgi:hypothetical protein